MRLRCLSAIVGALGAGPIATAALVLTSLAAPDRAEAYVGPSFLHSAALQGDWPGEPFKGWIKFEAHYWGAPTGSAPLYQGQSRLVFSGPAAPKDGAGTLSLSLDKNSRGLTKLMDICQRGTVIPELNFSEESSRARPPAELGLRPATIPKYWEYRLERVTLTCPVVDAAPEQAFVLHFEDIAWLNYNGDSQILNSAPAQLPPVERSGETRAYIVTWFWSANRPVRTPCPVMSEGPTEEEYYAFKSAEEIAREKEKYAAKGGVLANFRQANLRGPDELSVSLLPGIVADPGHPLPELEIVQGFDLDGDENTGGISPDGRKGIDNNLYRVDACIPGFGPKGILSVTTHEGRRNGETSMMVMVSGIDDFKNDSDVAVTVFYSPDPMIKDAGGKSILPGYTFRVSDNPERTPYFNRLRGRIENGIILTEPAEELVIDKGRSLDRIYQARMRLELLPDGTMSALLGGYQNWRELMNYWSAFGIFEVGLNFRMPAVYSAMKRAADGLKNPLTGEFEGISSAYEMKGVSAFVPPEQLKPLLAGKSHVRRAER